MERSELAGNLGISVHEVFESYRDGWLVAYNEESERYDIYDENGKVLNSFSFLLDALNYRG